MISSLQRESEHTPIQRLVSERAGRIGMFVRKRDAAVKNPSISRQGLP